MTRFVALVGGTVLAPSAWAGFNNLTVFQSIPTLDEIGLGTLIALVAGVAGWVVRKRSGRK